MRISLVLVVVLGSACVGGVPASGSGDGEGGDTNASAFLSVVGDRNVTLDFGVVSSLTVKYHDADGEPLAGTVQFRIQGDPEGALLSAATSVTDGDGLAQIMVTAGTRAAADFSVVAAAPEADNIDWRVTVGAGGTGGSALPRAAVAGTYMVDSHFDIISGLPGSAGAIVNTMIDLTDDPADPTSFLLDQIGGTAEDIIDPFRPFLDQYLNQRLLSYAPDFVWTFLEIGDRFGQVTRRFGVVTELDISDTGSQLVARHTVRGVHWTIDGVRYEFSTEELSLGTLVAENVPITYDGNGTVRLGEHEFPISYGQLLLFVLNQVIIPAVLPGAHSMGDVLSYMVDCGDVGWDIADYLGLGFIEAYLLSEGCDAVMDEVGDLIEGQIRNIGGSSGTALTVSGEATVHDDDANQRVDNIRNGLWEGQMRFGSDMGPLTRPSQTFSGESMP